MNIKAIVAILESLLFVAGEPLPLRKIQEAMPGVKKKEVQAALTELVRKWDRKDRGLRVMEVAGGYQFQTAPASAEYVGRLLQSRPARLSRPSLETLAMVAYKQPVTRTEIEEIRGVDTGGVLKTLLDYGFIRIVGRKDVPGKPLIYATDQRFMEFFRLKSLAELPTLKDLSEIQEEQSATAMPEGEGLLPLEDPGEDETGSEENGSEAEADSSRTAEDAAVEDSEENPEAEE